MERIAPLAKILAEANGIDWQHLDGSGDGGLIVEQDILNYLTRIMSGEEEPPATPVDAPPPEWTGTELPPGGGLLAPGMPSMDMLSSAGVDSDLAALVGQPAPVPSMPAPEASLPEVSLEDEAMEFELEDEPEIVAPAPEPAPFAAASEPVEVPVTPTLPMPSFSEPVPSEPVTPEPAVPAAAAAATGGVMGGLGGLLSRLYQKPGQDAAPASSAQPEPQPTAPAFTPAPASPFSAPVAEPTPVVPTFTPAPQPEPTPEPEVIPAPLPEVAAPEVVEEVAAEPAPMPAAPVQPEPTEVEPVAQPAPAEVQPEIQSVAAPIPAAPVREAVWFGPYLRRDGNVAPTLELCRQLAGALGQDVPLALLVARAAQRHAETLELGTVGVYRVGGEQARPVQSGSLREALAALDGDFAGTPDLLVTDAGALGLDELHLPHALTLSVGRVQGGRAALTLNGPVDPAQGARFLASVAATLEEPIILVI
ncbi:E3 binding domain-containing protein [Deinococcus sp. NW-56]|uniref:E3 binding domain-containing protein n=1 Tax=Deinococcus sp. NW-56 TaxID=2080419 RepID=UPI000CF4F90F|nr:E3 binding domain-containing protein [Deinococcus sp. NW-56]